MCNWTHCNLVEAPKDNPSGLSVRAVWRLNCKDAALGASGLRSDRKIAGMETRQNDCHGSDKMLGQGAGEDQEQQHGGNAMVLKAEEEGGKHSLVESKPAQGELDQGKLALGELAPGELAQEEPAQLSLSQEATGVEEQGEKKEEMGGGQAGDGSSGRKDNEVHGDRARGRAAQQQPQQEAAMPEGSKSVQAGDRQPVQRRTRFTLSQLQDLEHLFQETRYPSLRARKDLARWMGVSEADVQEWFRNRRAIFRRNSRMAMLSEVVPGPHKKGA